MTVEELINELSKIDDKTMKVNFPYSHGTQEIGLLKIGENFILKKQRRIRNEQRKNKISY